MSLGVFMVVSVIEAMEDVMKAAGVKRWFGAGLFLCVFGAPTVACAQAGGFSFSTPSAEVTNMLTTTTSPGLTGVGFGIYGLAVTTTNGASKADHTKSEEWQQYLRDNELSVRESLTLGQGEMVDEFASVFGLDATEQAALGRVLRKERVVLGELADPARLTPERAAQFAMHLNAVMGADATLAPALERRRDGA